MELYVATDGSLYGLDHRAHMYSGLDLQDEIHALSDWSAIILRILFQNFQNESSTQRDPSVDPF